MEKMKDRASRTTHHVMLLPFPAQGHISPMLQFAKRLASKGLKITIATPTFMSKFVRVNQLGGSDVTVETISDGFDGVPTIENCNEFAKQFEAVGSQSLARLIEQHSSSGYPVKCLVYDPTVQWALDVAKRLGICGAAFFTQSCAVHVIYDHAYQHQGILLNTTTSDDDQVEGRGGVVSIPGVPIALEFQDMPSFLYQVGPYQSIKDSVLNQFSNYQEPDWRFFNSFDKLEYEVVSWMTSQRPIKTKTVGPTVPSMYLDKRLEDDKDYGFTLFKSNPEACIQWLNTKEIGSVVYVSFGSLASPGEEQMEELAWGLKSSNACFLWVVRASEESKLPGSFVEETLEKGLVVNWCPQLQVLAHQAVGCFVTHCGWNSTLEALSLGVPIVAMPEWTDQPTNAKYIADVWQVGIRVKVNEKGIVTRQEIELCIREVMEGERGNELRMNSRRWKELAKEAVDEGGSSDKNIDEFVAELAHMNLI
uniref:Glycosyltransferase n=1 Tax=Davidia involucrata TaxID=16924 RepID=A0A5B6YHA7_DAVIN